MSNDGVAEKLPVWRTTVEAYRFVFGDFGRFLRLAFLPIVAVAVLSVVEAQVLSGPSLMSGVARTLVSLFFSLLMVAAMVPPATAWHRAAILGETHAVSWFSFRFLDEEKRFLFFTLGFYGLGMVGVFIGILAQNLLGLTGIVNMLVMLAAFLVIAYIAARYCLVLPAAAIGAPAGLGDSARATDGNVVNIWLVFILAALPIYVVLLPVLTVAAFPFIAMQAHTGAVIVGAIGSIILYLTSTAVMVSVLSMVFKFLTAQDMQHPSSQGGA